MHRSLLLLLSLCLSACAPHPAPTATVEPTQPQATSLQIPPLSNWAGGITRSDGTIESIIVHFDETNGTLNMEPKVKTYQFKNIQRLGSKISFQVTAENEMTFSGEYDGSQLRGQVDENGQTDSFTLLRLFSESNGTLDNFLGTYQFESGESLLINLAPEYSSSGLYFFGQGLMVTHFGTGAIRALYPADKDTFLVGRARAIGYPFQEQITFQRDATGKVSGLTWQSRNSENGELGESQSATQTGSKIRTCTLHE